MKNIILLLSFVISTNIFAQVDIISTGFSTPSIPMDTNFNPIKGKLQTKNLYYSKANDMNKDGKCFEYDNEINTYDLNNKSKNNIRVFKVDNQSKPSELILDNNNFVIKLKGKCDFSFSSYYNPFLFFNIDSVETYNTEYDFKVEFCYIGQSIESVSIVFDSKYNKRNLIASKNWFNSLTTKEILNLGKNLSDEQILNLWIEKTFLGSVYNENFTSNQRFSFYYTNSTYYTNTDLSTE